MSATCGPISMRQFAFFDPDGSCWRTWPAISLWGSEPYSGTWPKRGTTRSGAAFEHPTWEPPTDAYASSSLLPTPAAGMPNDGEDPESWMARAERLKEKHGNGNGAGMPLGIAVKMLPTPTCGDAKSARNSTANRKKLPPTGIHAGDTLTDAVTLLPTPSAADGLGGHERRGGSRGDELLLAGIARWGLRSEVRLLPTPQAHDAQGPKTAEQIEAMRARTGAGVRNLNEEVRNLAGGLTNQLSDGGPRGSSTGWGLRSEVRLLPTPTTSDTNGTGAHGDGGPDLRTAIGDLTSQLSDDGKPSPDRHPTQLTLEDDSPPSSSNG